MEGGAPRHKEVKMFISTKRNRINNKLLTYLERNTKKLVPTLIFDIQVIDMKNKMDVEDLNNMGVRKTPVAIYRGRRISGTDAIIKFCNSILTRQANKRRTPRDEVNDYLNNTINQGAHVKKNNRGRATLVEDDPAEEEGGEDRLNEREIHRRMEEMRKRKGLADDYDEDDVGAQTYQSKLDRFNQRRANRTGMQTGRRPLRNTRTRRADNVSTGGDRLKPSNLAKTINSGNAGQGKSEAELMANFWENQESTDGF